ncbi:hypothetical protein [Streptomyces coelicoflavus]|uniref:hypothetical protein n=1 Tax=Streptomyces coelicoflavus TaxID=285562 RepID=UPI003A855CC5
MADRGPVADFAEAGPAGVQQCADGLFGRCRAHQAQAMSVPGLRLVAALSDGNQATEAAIPAPPA